VIFGKPSKDVKCLVCGAVLARATGGKAIIVAKGLETVK